MAKEDMTEEDVAKYNAELRMKWIRAIVLHITLIITLIAYSFIGAAIFQVHSLC